MRLKLFIASLTVAFVMAPQLHAQNNDWVNFERYETQNKQVAIHPQAVLFGDSITDCWATRHPDFFKENNLIGRGISGQTSSQILLRFRKDVIALHPKYVAILCGVNDIALNDCHVSMEHNFDNLVSMCELAKANKIKPILCTTTPAANIVWRPEVKDAHEQILLLNEKIREYAKANKIRLVDYAAALSDETGCTASKYSSDGVHPNAAGYEVMGKMLMKVVK